MSALRALVLALPWLLPGLLFSPIGLRAESLNVSITNNLISIDAANASLIAIANRLSELSGIQVSYTLGNDTLITIKIVEEPLRKVVTKLSENNVIVTKKIDGEDVITEIMILLPVDQSSTTDANLPSGEPVNDVVVQETTPSDESVTDDTSETEVINSVTEQLTPASTQ